MTPRFLLSRILRRTLIMLPLCAAVGLSNAQVKPTAAASPAVSTTLDVCELSNGNWRYSGLVSVNVANPDAISAIGVDFTVQNKVSQPDYVNTYTARRSVGTAVGSTGAQAVPFVIDAAPLVLGTMRNTAQARLYDTSGGVLAQFGLAESEIYTAQVCGCQVKGCTRTQGYWSNKPNVVWPAPYARNASFFSSGLSWQQIMDSPTRGNAYLILAHQYVAAVLNRAAGASSPAGVQSVLSKATTFFVSGSTLYTCQKGSDCATQKTWAATLDTYNNGLYPGAPSHCPD